jgi:putative transposase
VRAAVGELPDGGRICDEVIDELLAGARTEEEIVGPRGLFAQLTKGPVERAMEVELTDHLGYEPSAGPVPIKMPRDRNGSFEPQIVRKGQRRFQGFDEKILAL